MLTEFKQILVKVVKTLKKAIHLRSIQVNKASAFLPLNTVEIPNCSSDIGL